ncbi:MAG: flagellar filament capping protein FliD [Pseudomonadota bacterium]
MPISPLDISSLTSNLAQFKGQSLSSLFDRSAGNSSAFNPASPLSAVDVLTNSPQFSSVLDQFSASLHMSSLPTSTTPTALDAAGSFSKPGQNMVTVLNRVEVTFKAQFAELGEMRKSLVHEQEAARHLTELGPQSDNAAIKTALDSFVASYNAGVDRFAPSVAKGGVLEGSWEANRARFATERDISYILNGSEVGLKGGLAALGVSTDPKTGLASVDQGQLDTALAKNQGNVLAALKAFGNTFVTTVDYLNAADHSQVRQMANLNRAVQWIADNKAGVQKEFGAGAAATPNEAFAKAAALYDQMALIAPKT